MDYNWEKIFKKKTDEELCNIFLGKGNLDNKAKLFAETELNIRKFDFNNIERYKKKWELEKLITEDRGDENFFGVKPWRSKDFLFMGIFGLLFLLLNVFNIFFEFLNSANKTQTQLEGVLFIFIGIGMTIIGFIRYRTMKKKEKYRKDRVAELIEEL